MEGEGGKGVRSEGGPGVLITRKLSHLLVHSRPPLPLLLPPQPPLPHPPLFFHCPNTSSTSVRLQKVGVGRGREEGRGQQPSERAPTSGTLSSPFGSLVTLYPDARTRSHTHRHAHASTLNCTRARASSFPAESSARSSSFDNTEGTIWQLISHFLSVISFLSVPCISPQH